MFKFFKGLGKEYLEALTKASIIGMILVSYVAGGAVLGYYIDEWQGTRPTWMLICLLLGAVGGANMVYREVRSVLKDVDKGDKALEEAKSSEDKSESTDEGDSDPYGVKSQLTVWTSKNKQDQKEKEQVKPKPVDKPTDWKAFIKDIHNAGQEDLEQAGLDKEARKILLEAAERKIQSAEDDKKED